MNPKVFFEISKCISDKFIDLCSNFGTSIISAEPYSLSLSLLLTCRKVPPCVACTRVQYRLYHLRYCREEKHLILVRRLHFLLRRRAGGLKWEKMRYFEKKVFVWNICFSDFKDIGQVFFSWLKVFSMKSTFNLVMFVHL